MNRSCMSSGRTEMLSFKLWRMMYGNTRNKAGLPADAELKSVLPQVSVSQIVTNDQG